MYNNDLFCSCDNVRAFNYVRKLELKPQRDRLSLAGYVAYSLKVQGRTLYGFNY